MNEFREKNVAAVNKNGGTGAPRSGCGGVIRF